MQISLSETGKRFNRDWIFRNFTFQFTQGGTYAITGPNGSGKSTLLQVIAGAVAASEGKIIYSLDGTNIEPDDAFRHLSISAPYQELIEEMTLMEFLNFHRKFKPFLQNLSVSDITRMVNLEESADKQIRYFSSGMRQRAKLAQAFFSDTSVLLLDEPCTNLDEEGFGLYHKLIAEYSNNRIVIVSSNDIHEFEFCRERIDMKNIGARQAGK